MPMIFRFSELCPKCHIGFQNMIRISDLVENDDQNLILNLLLIQKNVVPARSSLLWLGIAKVQFFCGVAWKCKSAVPCCTFFLYNSFMQFFCLLYKNNAEGFQG
jgi:hypothetical protein